MDQHNGVGPERRDRPRDLGEPPDLGAAGAVDADGFHARADSSRPLRLFVGIELDDRARDSACAAIATLERARVPARFEPREKLHVTVAFLGNVEPARLPEILAALRRIRAAPFRLPLERFGAFPDPQRARVVWLGPAGPSPAFSRCAKAVRNAYAALGFAFAAGAQPHVTLARLRAPGALPPLDAPERRALAVRELTLFSSLPHAGSTRYQVVVRHLLE